MNNKQKAIFDSNTSKKSVVAKKSNTKMIKKGVKKTKKNPNLGIIIGFCAIVVIVIAFIIGLSSQPSSSVDKEPAAANGILPKLDPSKYSGAANDFALKDTEGNEHKLSDNGGRLVLLDFTASWCGYCKQQAPDVHKLFEKYGNKVQFYAIDVNEPLQTVINYKNDDGAMWPFLLDSDGKVAAQYQVKGYPHYLLLNKDGTVIKPQSGYSPNFFNDFSQAIEANID